MRNIGTRDSGEEIAAFGTALTRFPIAILFQDDVMFRAGDRVAERDREKNVPDGIFLPCRDQNKGTLTGKKGETSE